MMQICNLIDKVDSVQVAFSFVFGIIVWELIWMLLVELRIYPDD